MEFGVHDEESLMFNPRCLSIDLWMTDSQSNVPAGLTDTIATLTTDL